MHDAASFDPFKQMLAFQSLKMLLTEESFDESQTETVSSLV